MAFGACVVAVALAPAPVGYAQNVAPAAVEMRTAQWQDAVRLHTRGLFDDTAATVARWPPDVTRMVVQQIIDQSRKRLTERRGKLLESDRAALRTALAPTRPQ